MSASLDAYGAKKMAVAQGQFRAFDANRPPPGQCPFSSWCWLSRILTPPRF